MASASEHTPAAAVISHGPRTRPWIALTFDADMTPGMLAGLYRGTIRSCYDAAIVDILLATRTPATFFVTGRWAQAYPNVLRELAAEALFEVENHSFNHGAFVTPCFGLPQLAPDEKELEVLVAAAMIARLTGVPTRYFRFPGGCCDADDVRLVAGLGHQPVGWDIVSGDASERDPKTVSRNVVEAARAGSIVALHLNGPPRAPATAAALRLLIPALRRSGFELVTVGRLLGGVGDCIERLDAL